MTSSAAPPSATISSPTIPAAAASRGEGPAKALPPLDLPKAPGPTKALAGGLGSDKDARLGPACEQKIETLVKERLSGGATDRTNLLAQCRRDKDRHQVTTQARLQHMALSAGEALAAACCVLAGHAHGHCNKLASASTVVVFDDVDDEAKPHFPGQAIPPPPLGSDFPAKPWPSKPAEDFQDLLASSPRTADAADSLGVSPAKSPAKTRGRTGDNASMLSVSGNMTSAASQLLSGLAVSTAKQRPVEPASDGTDKAEPQAPAADSTAASKVGTAKPVGNKMGSKSVITGISGTTSSAAQLLAAVGQKPAAASQKPAAPGSDSGTPQPQQTSQPQQRASVNKGGSKSVITGINATNSSAGALLSGLVQKQNAPKARDSKSMVG